MKILHIGNQGKLGKRLTAELSNKKVETIGFIGDALNLEEVKKQAEGVDVIVSTVGANTVEDLVKIAENIEKVAEEFDIRIVWSGGAATLIDIEGNRLADLPIDKFPEEMKAWIPAVYGHAKVLDLLKSGNLKWSFMSPALDFQDLHPTGTLRTEKTDKALYNSSKKSFASYISGAKALADEIVEPKFINSRFTIIEEI